MDPADPMKVMSVLISSSPPLPSLFTGLYQANKLRATEHDTERPPAAFVPRKCSKPQLSFPDAPFRPQLSFVRKKCVVFADSMGLPLTQVKVVKSEDAPDPPPALISPSSSSSAPSSSPITLKPALRLNFPQPVSRENFLGSILQNHVGIENVLISNFTLCGTILVHNICFQKEVTVRYTKDYWASHADVMAHYASSVSRDIDKFSFSLVLPDTLPPGARVEMCVCLAVEGETFWDNNFSQNYQVECVAQSQALSCDVVPNALPVPVTTSQSPAPRIKAAKVERIYY